jgi:hypothetical protein
VVAGDFNGDGFPDVVFSSRVVSGGVGDFSIQLLAGHGDGTFSSPVTLYSDFVLNLVAADIDGDGTLDLLFRGVEDIAVLIGNGDGTFRQPVRSPHTAFFSRPPVVVDLNRDGKVDVAVATQDGFVSIALGNGDGSFAAPALLTTTDGSRRDNLAAGDFNGDGSIDLIASNIGVPDAFNGSTLSLFAGHGDGTFAPPVEVPVLTRPGPLVATDLDGNGSLDVAVIGYQGGMSALPGNGDGTFLPRTTYPTAQANDNIGAADFNGDGRTDVAVCGSPNVLSIFPAIGEGRFGERIDFPALLFCSSIAIADFNLDGRPDIALLYSSTGGPLSIFLNTTAPPDGTPPVIEVSASPTRLWPANGRTIPVVVTGTVEDVGSGVDRDSVTYTVLDEYAVVQPSGSVSVDAAGQFTVFVPLTASRRGDDHDGRTYTIVIRALDIAGNEATARILVVVPHDARGGNDRL